jgi:excisionase family DNA binding protein
MTTDMHYLTAHEIATTMRVSVCTARRWMRTGSLPAVRVGRRWLIPRDALPTITAGLVAKKK